MTPLAFSATPLRHRKFTVAHDPNRGVFFFLARPQTAGSRLLQNQVPELASQDGEMNVFPIPDSIPVTTDTVTGARAFS